MSEKHEPPLVVLTDKSFYPMRRAGALGCCRCSHYIMCSADSVKNTPQICWDVGEGLETIWVAQAKGEFDKLPKLRKGTLEAKLAARKDERKIR